MVGKSVKSVLVIRATLWAELSLDVVLNVAKVEKIRSEKLRLRSTWRPLDSSFEWKGVLETVEICVLYSRWLSNQFKLVSENLISAIKLGVGWSELYFSRCCALKRTGTFAYVFILKSDVLIHFWHQSVCEHLFWKWGKLNLLHELRASLPEDQAEVTHAISPFWMKLCQIEGTTQ